MTPKQTPPSVHVNLCQSVICRRGEKRQDLQCSRVAGHGDPGSVDPIERHLHQIALGWCLAPWTEMAGQDGRTGGHDQRLHGRVLVGRSASDMLRALRLQEDRAARPAQYLPIDPEPAPAMVDAEGQPTLASLQMLNRPRYDWLVSSAEWLRHGAYPASYTFEQAVTEHLQRGIVTVEDAHFLRLIEAAQPHRVAVADVTVGDILHSDWHGEWIVTEVRVLSASVAITARRQESAPGSGSAQWLLEKWQSVVVSR